MSVKGGKQVVSPDDFLEAHAVQRVRHSFLPYGEGIHYCCGLWLYFLSHHFLRNNTLKELTVIYSLQKVVDSVSPILFLLCRNSPVQRRFQKSIKITVSGNVSRRC